MKNEINKPLKGNEANEEYHLTTTGCDTFSGKELRHSEYEVKKPQKSTNYQIKSSSRKQNALNKQGVPIKSLVSDS